MKFKKNIAQLFNSNDRADRLEKRFLEVAFSWIFALDPNAEIRISIKGNVIFIQLTDMTENEE